MIAPLVAVLVFAAPPKAEAAPLPGFHRGPWFREQAREEWTGFGTRFVVNAPADVSPDRPTRLVVFATPNVAARYRRGKAWIDRFCGAVIVALGIRQLVR